MTTVVHVIAPAEFGGAESVVAHLVVQGVKRGSRVALVTILEPASPVPAWVSAVAERGVELHVVRVGARSYLSERRAVGRILRGYPDAVVHLHGDRVDVLDSGVARSLGMPVLSTVHGFARAPGQRWLYEPLHLRALRKLNAVVAVSDVLARDLERRGVPPARLHLIPNGRVASGGPALSRATARERLGLSDGPAPVVGWVGRLSAEKGPDLAVEAWKHLGAGAGTHLCIVGDGRERAALERAVLAAGLESVVHFAGARADAAALLPAFDALLLSSRSEGTPMVVLEAVAARVPVLATAVGGVPSLLGASYPGLIPIPSADAIAETVRTFLARSGSGQFDAHFEAIERRLAADDWVGRYGDLYQAVTATRVGTA